MTENTLKTAGNWAEAQRVCDLPAVDEAIRALIEDNTGDNATCVVRAVLDAAVMQEPDGLSQWKTARYGYFNTAGAFVDCTDKPDDTDVNPRWVGGAHDMQLLRAALFATPQPAASVALTEDQRLYLHQAQEQLEERATEENSRGNNSTAKGCEASAHVIRELLAGAASVASGGDAVPIPLNDARHLLSWMDEQFGNDDGDDWFDTDAASVADGLDNAVAKFKRAHPAATAPLQPRTPEPSDDQDLVQVPRGLIGAACAAIERKHDAPKLLEKLRRYTFGDLSAGVAAHPRTSEPEATPGQLDALDDLVTMVRRLVRALSKAAPNDGMVNIAVDYLQRMGFDKGPFRSAAGFENEGAAQPRTLDAPITEEQVESGASALVDSCIAKGHWAHATDESKQVYRQHARAVLAAGRAATPQQAIPAVDVVTALQGKYANVLAPFLVLMVRELHANTGKGDRPGWLMMSRSTAILEIYHHVAKLQKAVKNDDAALISEHSADVANMAMMLLDVCGGLDVAGIAQTQAAAGSQP